jgi:hypothetical protein
MKRVVLSLLAAWGLCVSGVAQAGEAKNLKVLPKNTSMKDLKDIMKMQAKSLGVQCEHCHDTNDFSADAREAKKTAREMMTMEHDLNKRFFAGKDMVTCMTCHGGQKFPAAGGADLDKVKAAGQ